MVPSSTRAVWTTWSPGAAPPARSTTGRSQTRSPRSSTRPAPGLTNTESDAIHDAYKRRQDDPSIYRDRVDQALDYKIDVLESALDLLAAATGLGPA